MIQSYLLSPAYLQQFQPRLLCLSSKHSLTCHGSTTTNQHHCSTGARSCLPRPAGTTMSLFTAATVIAAVAAVTADPTTITMARVTAITVITAARRSWQSSCRDDIDSNVCHIDDSDHGGSCDTRRSARAAAAGLADGRSSLPQPASLPDIRPLAI